MNDPNDSMQQVQVKQISKENIQISDINKTRPADFRRALILLLFGLVAQFPFID